jgi:hypothetical protein
MKDTIHNIFIEVDGNPDKKVFVNNKKINEKTSNTIGWKFKKIN